MTAWFVVHTQPGQEMVAERHLKNQGFEVYLPRLAKTRSHARKVDVVASPLFPRYMFVGFDKEQARWRSINGTRGVSYILTQDNRPAEIPAEIIANLKAEEDDKGFVSSRSLNIFKSGDVVNFTQGALEGLSGIVDSIDAKGRIAVLFDFLGRVMKVTMPAYAVKQS